MRLFNGKIIATNEDYALAPNEIHVDEIGPFIAFRILTEDGQLFCIGVDKDAPPAEQAAVALTLKRKAETAPKLETVVPSSVLMPDITPAEAATRVGRYMREQAGGRK